MRRTSSLLKLPLVLAALIFSLGTAGAGQGAIQSTQEMIFDAFASYDGIRVVPAGDIPPKHYTEDHGPSQVLEIIRKNMEPITVGRLSLSCSCMKASMEKTSFGQGERAFIELRKVKPSPQPGATFAMFVQLLAPYKAAIQYDIPDQPAIMTPPSPSGHAPTPPPPPAPPRPTENHLAPARSIQAPPPGAPPAPRQPAVKTPSYGYKFEDVQPYQPRKSN